MYGHPLTYIILELCFWSQDPVYDAEHTSL
jgi:hypothetical protein